MKINSGCGPFFRRRGHTVEGIVLPKKVSCPIPAACSGVGALARSGYGVRKRGIGALPLPGLFFRRLFDFQGAQVYIFMTACAVYLNCEVGNQPGKLTIFMLLALWYNR